MHTNWCVLIEISMEIGMLNFWLGLLVTAQTIENYFKYLNELSIPKKNVPPWMKSAANGLENSLKAVV